MSLNAPLGYAVPEETARVAQAAFPKGTRYMKMRDVFGPIYSNAAFAHLFPRDGQPAEDPARLALVLIITTLLLRRAVFGFWGDCNRCCRVHCSSVSSCRRIMPDHSKSANTLRGLAQRRVEMASRLCLL